MVVANIWGIQRDTRFLSDLKSYFGTSLVALYQYLEVANDIVILATLVLIVVGCMGFVALLWRKEFFPITLPTFLVLSTSMALVFVIYERLSAQFYAQMLMSNSPRLDDGWLRLFHVSLSRYDQYTINTAIALTVLLLVSIAYWYLDLGTLLFSNAKGKSK